jgi:glyoxylase-like metal-dependent hydrolase (beta-lactamase superfamily II)
MNPASDGISRREFVRNSGPLSGGLYLCRLAGGAQVHMASKPHPRSQAQTADETGDAIEQMIAYLGGLPVVRWELRDNLFMLFGPGGNIDVLVGPVRAILIDAGLAAAHERILASIGEATPASPGNLINTHFRFDHTGGKLLMHEAGARIMAQENVRKPLSGPYTMALHQHTFPPFPAGALPVITFSRSTPVAIASSTSKIRTSSTRAICSSTASILCMSAEGRMDGMVAAANRVRKIAGPKTIVIPRHGPVGTTMDLCSLRDIMTSVTEQLTKRIAAGETDEQIVAAKPTADFDSKWGGGCLTPDRFVSMACYVVRTNH